MVVGNLTAFTLYSITITAFTGQLSNARRDGKVSEPVFARTLEDGEDVCACLFLRYLFALLVTFTVVFSRAQRSSQKFDIDSDS